MQGNLHVRFGEGDEETYLGDKARRSVPTPRATPRFEGRTPDNCRHQQRAHARRESAESAVAYKRET